MMEEEILSEGLFSDEIENLSISEIIQKNTSKSARNLRAFFNSGTFITEKKDQNTNIINVGEKKTYNIPTSSLPEFFTLLEKCRRDGNTIHWAERQETATQSHSGIMIDFDRYQKSSTPQVTHEHFGLLASRITKLLNEFLDLNEHAIGGKISFHVFVIRKPAIIPVEGSAQIYKDGFHILIPEIQTTKALKRYMMSELMGRGDITTIFSDIDHYEPADKMLDKMSPSVPVNFVGCSKFDRVPYKLVYATNVILNRFGDITQVNINIDTLNGEIPKAILVEGGELTEINLIYELSLQYVDGIKNQWLRKKAYRYKPEFASKINTIAEKTANDVFTDDELRKDEEDISLVSLNNPRAKHILAMLKLVDISYATEYEKWFKVICAIAHCGSTEDYKSVAREFSRRNPKSWSQAEFERVWNEALSAKNHANPVTIGSIRYWAKISSPQAYSELKKNNYCDVLRRFAFSNEGKITHAPCARVTQITCEDKFVCDVGFNEQTKKFQKCWYEFVTPGQSMKKGEVYKYRLEFEPDNIHLFIADHMPKIYEQVRADIKNYKDQAGTEIETKYWSIVDKNFKTSMSNLGDDTYQKKVVNQCTLRFRRRGFYEELDSYPDILGVGNGILKLGITPQLITGHHEYKISKYTEVDYSPFNPECPYQKTLLQAYRDIFPEPDVFTFLMCHASTGLDNCEPAFILLMLVGGGQNGKSFFLKMIHNTLGSMYCASGKPSLLTSKIEDGKSANEAQMQQEGKRYFYIDEFEDNSTLNTTRVKSMVSAGYQSGRGNYKNQTNFKNTSNTICSSNFDFHIDTHDHGTWRRMYYYKNKVKFCSNPDPNNPFEKKEDRRFIEQYPNDPNYLKANLSILTHFNSILRRDYGGDLKNIPVPTIMHETEIFRNRADTLNRFLTQMIIKSPDAEPIALSSLADKYIHWYPTVIKSGKVIVQSDVMSQLQNSRVSKFITTGDGGIQHLNGFRIKDFLEEPLKEGEEYISVIVPKKVDATADTADVTAVNTAADVTSEIAVDATVDEFNFEINAPVHTQKEESIDEDLLYDLFAQETTSPI